MGDWLKTNSEKPRERGSTNDVAWITRRKRRAYYRFAESPVNGAEESPLVNSAAYEQLKHTHNPTPTSSRVSVMNNMWWLVMAVSFFLPLGGSAQDVNEETEKAMKAAAAKVAPAVVRIETSGGQDMIVWTDRATGAPIRKVAGPTTGLIVDADGYVITSSFNFINKPTDIFVQAPGRDRVVAKVIATDHSRMLTLLKFEQKGLPVPEAYPKKDMQVGQWALALGRTFDPKLDHPPSISAGILSALGRIWGKAVQCDCKVSPVNYGGPLVALDGRVQGVLVPASATSEGDNAGIEWYDSGIGFAIPLEDVFRVLPKMKTGTSEKPVNLRGGLFGFPAPSPNDYFNPPLIKQVMPKSAAEEAGVKSGDLILEVNGKKIFTMAQFLHTIKPLYEGDSIKLKVKRGGEEKEIAKVTLKAAGQDFDAGFLGILPMRDDPEPGVEIRFVYPDSPAEKAGLKAGDRIMKLGPPGNDPPTLEFSGRDQFLALFSTFPAHTMLKLEFKNKEGKTKTETVTLTSFPEEVPEALPMDEPSKKHALEKPKPVGKVDPKMRKKEPKVEKKDPKEEKKDAKEDKKDAKEEEPKKKIETGKLKRSIATLGFDYWLYVPENYDPNIAHGVVMWFHPAGREGRDMDDMVKIWDDFCEAYHLIMMGPISTNKAGWVASETDNVIKAFDEVARQYTIDRQRVVAHGSGIGGQMAYYLGFNAREQVRGVATVGAVLANQPKDLIPGQRLQFYIAAGEKDPIVKDIAESKPKLTEKKYSVIFKKVEDLGKQYLDEDPRTFREMLRWIDTLDRQ